MKPDFIEKLPPDAQKEFLKLAMKLDEKTKQEKVQAGEMRPARENAPSR